MFWKFIKRLIVVIVLLGLIFVIYRYINPDGASNLVEKIKNILPEKFFNKDSTWDVENLTSDDLIISGTTTSIVNWDITRENLSNNSDLNNIDYTVTTTTTTESINTWNVLSEFTQALEESLDNTIVSQSLQTTWGQNTWSQTTGQQIVKTWNIVVNTPVTKVQTTTVVKTTTTSSSSKLTQKDINDAKNLLSNIIE